MNALKAAADGEYLIVGHLAYNDAEIRNLGHPGYPGDAVAHKLALLQEKHALSGPGADLVARGVETVRDKARG